MSALFARLGVDYGQWKAVSRTLLRADFRAPTSPAGERYSLGTVGGPVLMVLVYGMFGLSAALLIAINPDVRLTSVITLAYLAFLLITAVMTDHGLTMIVAGDHVILAPRPVSPRTYFAIRLTHVLFHTLLITLLMAWPPVVAFTIAHAPSVVRGVAAAVALAAWAVTLTLTLIAMYGAVVRVVGRRRMTRAMGYLQMGTGVMAYGGLLLLSQRAGRGAIQEATLADTPLLLLVPPAWFASYVEIASGDASTLVWLRAGLSVLALALSASLISSRLSAEYAPRLAEALAAGDPAPEEAAWSPPRRLVGGDARAVAILVLAHFRHDLRVRMGVLGVVPLIVFYLALGGGDATRNPFDGGTGTTLDFAALAALLFPGILLRQFGASDAYRAGWIYGVATIPPGRLALALAEVATRYFLVPFVALLAALFTWRFGNAIEGLTHAAMLGLVSHLMLHVAVLVSPRLPFAQPPERATRSAGLFAWMFMVVIGGQGLLWLLQAWVYASWTRTAMVAALLVAAAPLLRRAISRRTVATPS